MDFSFVNVCVPVTLPDLLLFCQNKLWEKKGNGIQRYMRILFALVVMLQTSIYSFQHVELYYSPRCPYSQKVLSYIKNKNMQLPLKDVTTDANARDTLKEYGGYLIVPCLLVDKSPIYNVQNIIDWLGNHEAYLTKSRS